MATNTNFTSLTTDIQQYLERGGSTTTDPIIFAQIPRRINAAERKIAQTMKLLGMLTVLVNPAGLVAGQSVIAKPDRWRETVSINYGVGPNSSSHQFLLPRSYEYCRTYWPDATTIDPEQPPLFYADYHLLYWLIVPTPPATYPLEVLAYLQPPYLDNINQTNFFSEYTPNLLLYGTLLEFAPLLKNDERIPTWQGLWDTEAKGLVSQDLQRVLDRAAERKSV